MTKKTKTKKRNKGLKPVPKPKTRKHDKTDKSESVSPSTTVTDKEKADRDARIAWQVGKEDVAERAQELLSYMEPLIPIPLLELYRRLVEPSLKSGDEEDELRSEIKEKHMELYGRPRRALSHHGGGSDYRR